jgi:hypothetical protein
MGAGFGNGAGVGAGAGVGKGAGAGVGLGAGGGLGGIWRMIGSARAFASSCGSATSEHMTKGAAATAVNIALNQLRFGLMRTPISIPFMTCY